MLAMFLEDYNGFPTIDCQIEIVCGEKTCATRLKLAETDILLTFLTKKLNHHNKKDG